MAVLRPLPSGEARVRGCASETTEARPEREPALSCLGLHRGSRAVPAHGRPPPLPGRPPDGALMSYAQSSGGRPRTEELEDAERFDLVWLAPAFRAPDAVEPALDRAWRALPRRLRAGGRPRRQRRRPRLGRLPAALRAPGRRTLGDEPLGAMPRRAGLTEIQTARRCRCRCRWRWPGAQAAGRVEPQCVYLISSSRSEPPETSIARTAWPLPLA
jgi:hypothetical protein